MRAANILSHARAQSESPARGLIADIAIHKTPIGEPDQDHAHVMVPPRTILVDGSWNKKKERLETVTERKEQLEQWRAAWAQHCNEALEQAGYGHQKIDHRSNKDRKIEALPTIHEGYAAQGIEARGGLSWRAEHNRQIRQHNQILAQIKARVTQAANAAKRAATAIADGFAQFGKGPGETAPKSKPKPALAPTWQPPPMRKPDKLAEEARTDIPDVEAEKRKKAAREAAWRQQGGGGGGIGG